MQSITRFSLAAVSIALTLSLASCGTINAPFSTSSSGVCKTVTRLIPVNDSCMTWTGNLYGRGSYDQAKTACTGSNDAITTVVSTWTDGTGSCDSTDVVGTCTVSSKLADGGSFTFSKYYYSTSLTTGKTSDAQVACDEIKKSYPGSGDTVNFTGN